MEAGWIKLHRKIRDNKLWTKKRRFSMAEAWIDLLLSASHRDHEVIRDYGVLSVKRGQVLTSQVELSKKWRWHRESTIKFLLFLKADIQIDIQTSRETSTGYTLITICNYEKYQGSDEEETSIVTQEETSIGTDIRPTSARHPPDTIKNGKKGKNEEIPLGFAELWAAHPGPKGPKGDAVKAYREVDPPETVVELLIRQVQYKAACDRRGEFCPQLPHLFRWLKKRRWEDEVPTDGNGRDPYALFPRYGAKASA